MSEVAVNDGNDKGKKVKQKKMNLRVDFTPMVDMNMLLITFFMLCSTLQKPQTMEISMPDNKATKEEQTKVRPERALTVILAPNDKVFYYNGEPNYEDYNSLKETSYTPEGLRKVVLGKNANIYNKVEALKEKKRKKEITEEDFNKEVLVVKNAIEAPVVIIKPMDGSTYKNMVDALDEMLICNVGKYAIDKYSEVEDFLLKNLQTKGNAASN